MHKKLSANFIGCGKLGKTIAALFFHTDLLEIKSIFNQTKEKASKSVEFIGTGMPCCEIKNLEKADIYFICTPDDKIKSVCEDITKNHTLDSKNIFIHFSGSLTSDELNCARLLGCQVGSLHPMHSFANPLVSVKNFAGTYCSYEGTKASLPIIQSLVEKIEGKLIFIEKENKAAYHAAAVIACNYLITIAQCASQCYEIAGIQPSISKDFIASFMQGTLNNINHCEDLKSALTGPLQRGDGDTVKKHLQALEKAPDLKNIYSVLAMKTLELTTHSEEKKHSLAQSLTP